AGTPRRGICPNSRQTHSSQAYYGAAKPLRQHVGQPDRHEPSPGHSADLRPAEPHQHRDQIPVDGRAAPHRRRPAVREHRRHPPGRHPRHRTDMAATPGDTTQPHTMTTTYRPAAATPSTPSAVGGTDPAVPATDAVRVAFRAVSRPSDHAALDGVWWPHSRDLAAELPALVAALGARGFATGRVAYSRQSWDGVLKRLLVAGHVIRLGWFRTIDPNSVSMTSRDGRKRVDLLVVPSA